MTASGEPCPAGTIWFYALNENENPYRVFSNFAHYDFKLNGRTWPTTEHYFQAMKFHQSKDDFEAVAALESPMDAAAAGRDRKRPLRPDWESVKDGIMYDCVLEKIRQNSELEALLESSGDAVLVERTKNDSYWGDGGDGTGKNMLGVTLMKVRQDLRQQRGGASTAPVTATTAPASE